MNQKQPNATDEITNLQLVVNQNEGRASAASGDLK
jgi:hypothetical protein